MKTNDLFVIDTNVLISAFILPRSVARKALDKARNEGQIALSMALADELTDVLIRPKFDKYLPLAIRLEIIDDFISLAYSIEPQEPVVICRDPKDDKILELALAAHAKLVISGDQDLLILNPFKEISIITASSFLDNY